MDKKYVVFKKYTLGYLFNIGNYSFLGILYGKLSKGGLNWRNGYYMVNSNEMQYIRIANQKDFDYFNVSSKGHI